jgi:hypothetical protein
MKRVFKTLLTFLPRRAHAPCVPSARRYPALQRRLVVEPLEARTVPSTSVLGVPAPDLPPPPALKPQPLMIAPVSAEPGPENALPQVLDKQPLVSFTAPVPEFLTPAAPTTVATPLTGPLAITRFDVDNAKLGQLTSNLQVPDSPPVWLAAPTIPDDLQSASGPGVVQVVIAPVRLEWLGLRIETGLIQVTATVEHLGGKLLARVEEILASVARTFAQVVSLVAAKLIAAAEYLVSLLPPLWLRALGRLAPHTPVTAQLAHYQVGPVTAGYQASWHVGSGMSLGTESQLGLDQQSVGGNDHETQSLSEVEQSPLAQNIVSVGESGHQAQTLSVSKVTVDVYADTGPDKPLGNVLVEADRRRGNSGNREGDSRGLSNDGFSDLTGTSPEQDAGGLLHLIPDGRAFVDSIKNSVGDALHANTGGGGLPGGGGGFGFGDTSQNDAGNGAPMAVRLIVVRSGPVAMVSVVSAAVGGTSAPPTLLPRKQPEKEQTEGASESQETLFEDDNPLPQILPEIGLPDESIPLRQVLPEGSLPDETLPTLAQRSMKPLARPSAGGWLQDLNYQVVKITVCLPQGQQPALWWGVNLPANDARRSCPLGRGASPVVAQVRVPAQRGPGTWCENLVEQSRDISSIAALDDLRANPSPAPADGSDDGLQWQSVVGLLSRLALAIIISPPPQLPRRSRSRVERKRWNSTSPIFVQPLSRSMQ